MCYRGMVGGLGGVAGSGLAGRQWRSGPASSATSSRPRVATAASRISCRRHTLCSKCMDCSLLALRVLDSGHEFDAVTRHVVMLEVRRGRPGRDKAGARPGQWVAAAPATRSCRGGWQVNHRDIHPFTAQSTARRGIQALTRLPLAGPTRMSQRARWLAAITSPFICRSPGPWSHSITHTLRLPLQVLNR